MRTTEQCPKCQSHTIWVVGKIQLRDPTRSEPSIPFSLAAGEDISGNRIEAGTFEAWVCANCGYTELYAKDFHEKLAALARYGWNGIRLISRNVPTGPFR